MNENRAQVDLILNHARMLLPDAYQAPIADGAVAIKDGRIADFGTTGQINEKYQAAEALDMSGKLLMPGLVDCHNHLGNWNLYAIQGMLRVP